MIFLVQFGINKHLQIFQRPQIALALRARAIFLVFEKFTRACLFQIIALEIMWLPIFILLPEKFRPLDCLRAEVFQLNLKYLHVKITVTMVTQNHQIISSHELRKNGGKISRFWNQEIQELKENSENQNTEKSTSTWLNIWTSWAENKNFKTNLLADEAKQLDKNKHMALDDWISQVVV